VFVCSRAPEARLVDDRGQLGHAAERGLAVLSPIGPGQRGLRAIAALDEAEGPALQERRAASQRLADLAEQEHLGGPQREEPAAPAPVGEQLQGVEQRLLLLHIVEHDQAEAVVQPAGGIGGETQPLVRIVERGVDGRVAARGQALPDQRRLPGLAGAREDHDRARCRPPAEEVEEAVRLQAHRGAVFRGHCRISGKMCR
jgi:hypothetical protein